ncbi:HAD family hydrolase [Mucilaginibacter paludis]|uniref:HAD-superfamily hydrolase, subfamily IA, variant 3 n=1 Tax=Mucilaginibacter paludis DSM 18603 TaxID=714943 RepID=H1Y1T0_9SPHI|nr:HAD family phosphatase [Mucilaginibacter paludis]EHQ24739.1 HAD-superfamily hydrolase, subfamily IA, variant 3 [Mucilaginibacter paludis DSM 18603]
MTHIKNIIFDYGNVIFTIDFAIAQKAWADLGVANVEQFFGHREQDEVFNAFDKGEISADEFRKQIRIKAGNANLTDEQINHAWNSMLLGIPEGNHELLLKLKDKYRTFLLSNINAIHYDYIMDYLKREFGFDGNDHLFEKVYYSHLMGKRKPNADIFEQILQENNLKPEETLFIDDSPQHLATAEKLGMQVFLMKAPDTIQAFIARENL